MTKAEVLNLLRTNQRGFFVEELLFFSVQEWKNDEDYILNDIEQKFFGDNVIVRSSAVVEDGENDSCAGKFKSILNVPVGRQTLKQAIDEVIESYDVLSFEEKLASQIIVQFMTDSVKLSGVIFSRENINGLPYYLINYERNNTTNSITSGETNGIKEYIYHGYNKRTEWSTLIVVIKYIKKLLAYEEVDVEFAITCNEQIVIFQARRLYISARKYGDGILDALNQYRQISNHILSDMAFWNPSEMIGTRPKTLARTLYEYLITDRTWNEGIILLGYKKMRKKLMASVLGKPYIFMDVAFDALLPAEIQGVLREKLLSIYWLKIEEYRYLHDKIEFQIVDSCFSFNLNEKIEEYIAKYNLSFEEAEKLTSILKNHIVKFVNEAEFGLEKSLLDIRQLEKTRSKIFDKYRDSNRMVEFSDVVALLKEARVFGVSSFAYIARMAFMTEQVLRSAFCEEPNWRKLFEETKSNIVTVATVCNNTQSFNRDLFRRFFSHLRPGTYNIEQQTYDNIFDILALGHDAEESIFLQSSDFDQELVVFLQAKFDQVSIDIDAAKFLGIYSASLQRREYYKYCFTKNVSLSLELLKRHAECVKISKQNLADINIKKSIEAGSLSIDFCEALPNEFAILPEVILEEDDILNVIFRCAVPNFVTEEVVEGSIFYLGDEKTEIPPGSIVVTEKADPGYDWIFACNIKALITKYGGSASHMTIRCNELGITAAIGCGELLYEKIIKNNYVTIDCRNKTII